MAEHAIQISAVSPKIGWGEPVYRKILRTGRTHYMAVSTQMPIEWEIVSVTVNDLTADSLTLTIRKIAPR